MKPSTRVIPALLFVLTATAIALASAGSEDSHAETGEFVVMGVTYSVEYDTSYYSGAIRGIEGAGDSLDIPESIPLNPQQGITIRSIHYGAFSHCDGVRSISIPSTVGSIDDRAFSHCTSLRSIAIDSGNEAYVNGYGGLVFLKGSDVIVACPARVAMTEYAIPQSVVGIRPGAFESNYNLKVVTFPGNSSLASIPDFAFSGSQVLEKMVLSSGIVTIGDSAFRDCTSLAEIDFGQNPSLRDIGANAFRDCKMLTSLGLPGSVASIGDWSFLGSGLNSITFSSGLVSIGDGAFKNCSGIESIVLPSTVSGIGSESFHGCTGLERIEFRSTAVTELRSGVFGSCTSLRYVVIPATVTSIAASAFNECTSMGSFLVSEGNTDYSSDNGVLYNMDKTVLVSYPAGREVSGYSILPGVERIGDYAFMHTGGLVEVTIPSSVTAIGVGAFQRCSNLETIMLKGDSLKTIGINAFSGCVKLRAFEFPDGIESIGDNSFYSCNDLRVVRIPSNAVVKPYAFHLANNIISIAIGDGAVIENDAFHGYRFDGGLSPESGKTYSGESQSNLVSGRCALLYHVDGEEDSFEIHEHGSVVSLKALPSKEGVAYSDWTFNGATVSESFAITETMVLCSESSRVISSEDVEVIDGVSTIIVEEDSVYLPPEVMESLEGVTRMRLDEVTFELDRDSLNKMSNGSEVKLDVRLTAGIQNEAALSRLSEEDRRYASDAVVVSIDIDCVGVTDGLGRIKVTAPCVLRDDMLPRDVSVYYITEDGALERMDASYSNGYVTFVTDHFSEFAVCKTLNENPYYGGDPDDDHTLLFIGIGSALVLIALVGFAIYRKKKS